MLFNLESGKRISSIRRKWIGNLFVSKQQILEFHQVTSKYVKFQEQVVCYKIIYCVSVVLRKNVDNPCLKIAGINFFMPMDVDDTTMMKCGMNFSLMELEPSERTRYECHDWRVNLYSTVEIPCKPNFY